jgi:2-polyprenyl-6-hydroxyphenyl methylase/3-demethylubiquinone-9 3-methyltransferase
MWAALENVAPRVAPGGKLFLALYNDQGRASALWKRVKKVYCASPEPLRTGVLMLAFARLWGPTTMRDLIQGRAGATWRNYGKGDEGKAGGRGMSPWQDVVDWVGGHPFEVARPEEVLDFYRKRGFELERLLTCAGGHGCNEYVFARKSG